MRAFIVIVLLVAVAIGVTGFVRGWFSFSTSSDGETAGITGTIDRGKVKQDRDAAFALFQSSRDKYQQQADTDLKAMDRGMADLKAKAKNGREVTKDSMNETIGVLDKKTEAARAELQQLKSATTENWEALKTHFSASMTELKGEYEQASKRFMSELALTP
jgi:uncharacterized protein YPO0396